MSVSTSHSFTSLSPAEWERLSRRTVYFGHQSVGKNILSGVRLLVDETPHADLPIFARTAIATSPGIAEFKIGTNCDPRSKSASFVAQLAGAPLGPNPALLFKYCYIDMLEETDADVLFRHYCDTVDLLHQRHPQAQIIHVTMPLTVLQNGGDSLNVHAKRSRYNQLLRSHFRETESVFDLAAVESTHADCSQETITHHGETITFLAPEWTSDGGHLNTAGSRRAAATLLRTLACLPVA